MVSLSGVTLHDGGGVADGLAAWGRCHGVTMRGVFLVEPRGNFGGQPSNLQVQGDTVILPFVRVG